MTLKTHEISEKCAGKIQKTNTILVFFLHMWNFFSIFAAEINFAHRKWQRSDI